MMVNICDEVVAIVDCCGKKMSLTRSVTRRARLVVNKS